MISGELNGWKQDGQLRVVPPTIFFGMALHLLIIRVVRAFLLMQGYYGLGKSFSGELSILLHLGLLNQLRLNVFSLPQKPMVIVCCHSRFPKELDSNWTHP